MNAYRGFVSAVGSVLLICAGCSETSMSKSDQNLYLQVIARIKSGEIKTDGEKGIQPSAESTRLAQSASLPSDLQKVSSDGQIYIFRPSPSQLLVVFKTWQGKGFNMEGWLYAAVPFGPHDTSKDAYGKSVVTLGPMDFALEKPVNTNWYHVSYKLD
jgi:hypothetical protein